MSTDFFDALEGQLRTAHGRRARRRRAPRVPIRPLAASLAAIAIVLVLVSTLGGESEQRSAAPGRGERSTTADLHAPAGSRAGGQITILRDGGTFAMRVRARGLAPTGARRVYAVWLTAHDRRPRPLGFAPAVASDGRLSFAAVVPDQGFSRVLITRESRARRTRPGRVALSGFLHYPRAHAPAVPQIDPGTGTAFRLEPRVADAGGSGETGRDGRSVVLRLEMRGLEPRSPDYWLWLTAPGRPPLPLGRLFPVDAGGRLSSVTELPGAARDYGAVLVTKESVPAPAHPGNQVLTGRLPDRRARPGVPVRGIGFDLTGSVRGLGFLAAPRGGDVATVKASGLLPTAAHRFYAAWLIAADGRVRFVAYAGVVGGDGRMNDVFTLPSDARAYVRLLITRESGRGHVELQRPRGLPGGPRIVLLKGSGPRVPGPVVMSGPLPFEKLSP